MQFLIFIMKLHIMRLRVHIVACLVPGMPSKASSVDALTLLAQKYQNGAELCIYFIKIFLL